jgi:hypothetical protein
MSASCNLALHYDCGEFDDDACECPCHDEELT